MPGKYQYDIELKSNVAKLLTDMKEVQDRLDTVEGKEYKIKLNVDEKKLSNVISNLEKMLDSLGKGTGDFKQFENLSKELSSIVSEVQNLSKAFGKVDDSGTKTLLSSIQNIDKSLSELSQHIINVNKNMDNMGGNTNGAVKQVENITDAYTNAAKGAEKLAEAQSKIGNKSNISSGTQIEDVFQGDDKVNTDASTTAIKEESRALEQVSTSAKDAASSKEKFAKANKEVKASADSSTPAINKESDALKSEWDKNVKAIQDYMDAVTKFNNLNAKDKGTGKYASQIALQEKNVEELKEKALEARIAISSMVNPHDVPLDTWKDYLDTMKKFDQASLGSAESVAKLEDALRKMDFSSLESAGTKFKSQFDNLSIKPDGDHQFLSWTNDLKELNAKIDEYNSKVKYLKDNNIVDGEQVVEVKNLRDEIEKTINIMTKTPQSKRGWTDIGASKAAEKVANVLKQNTKMSKEAKDAIRAYYNELRSGNPSQPIDEILVKVNQLVQKERELGRVGKSFGEIFKDKVIYGGAAQLAGMFGFYDIINIFRDGIDTLKEFDDGLTKISYTMDMTKSQLDNLGSSVLDMASDMKSSIDDAMQVAQIYANMQTSAEEIQRLSEPTLILSNLSGFDSSTIADDIQAVTQQFDILAEDSMHIADVYDYISRNIAVDYSKGLNAMAEGLQVAGSTAKSAGLDFEQTASIIAKAVEKTRLDGSQVGNGLKTILTRTSKVGELSDEVDNETLSQASESLKKIGIEVYNLDGSYRQFDVIMTELAGKWDNLTDAEKSNISFSLAATRQTNLLSAILSNFSDSMQLAEEATNANGSALENQQKYMESFSGHLQSLETEAKIAWLNILDSETLKDGVDLLTGLVKVVGQLVDTFGLLGTAAGIGGIVAGFKNIGRPKKFGFYKYADINMCSLGY